MKSTNRYILKLFKLIGLSLKKGPKHTNNKKCFKIIKIFDSKILVLR